jgi:hypothetical protein
VAEISYSEELEIRVPAETLFGYRLDFEKNLPQYNPNVGNMRRTDPGTDLGPGATYEFEVTMPEMGGTLPSTLRVIEIQQLPLTIINETLSGVFRAREVVTFEPSDGGTRARFEVTVTMPDDMAAVGPLAEQSGREQVRLELDHMRKELEG